MSKRPTQMDVARLAGVSRATVSYVVNGLAGDGIPILPETRQRVLDAIAELDYQPDARAQSLRRGALKSVGLLIPDMHNPHHWQITAGVEQQLRAEGYDLVLTSTYLDPDQEANFLNALSRRRMDGLILLLTFANQLDSQIKALVKGKLPAVLLGKEIDGLDSVEVAYYDGGCQVMAHLLDLGHQHIGFIHGVAHPSQGRTRLKAYRDTLSKAGLPVDDDLIEHSGTTLEAGYQAASRLLDRQPRPTAILVINDLLAIGALHAISNRGLRVPEDISIASFDDIAFSEYANPPLTTVQVLAEEIGRTTARLLLMRLQNPDLPPQHIRMPTSLIVRGSTSPALM